MLRPSVFSLLGCIAIQWLNLAVADIPTFPGAEGAGQYAQGGRGGDVFYVTSLEDDGPGTLRHGITSANGPRTILFATGGTIRLQSDLAIERPYLTIAGQSAPGQGITLADRSVIVNGTHDVVLQFLRIRTGDTYTHLEGYEPDALWIRNSRNIMVDHISTSWGVDETLSVTHSSRNVTVQWSLITEALHNAGHTKGDHGYGSLINGGDITFHHNLYAQNRSRNPRPGDDGRLDFVNNIIYNPGNRYGYSGSGDTFSLNYVGNYGIDGPQTTAPSLFHADDSKTRIYTAGNYRDTARNRLLDGTATEAVDGEYTSLPARTNLPGVVTTHAPRAYVDVLSLAGASIARDAVDHRIVASVLNQTGQHLDSQEQVGGWPHLDPGTLPPDSNQDGIPDHWIAAHGLDPNTDYARVYRADGYTVLESYLHDLVAHRYHLPPQVADWTVDTARGRGADAVVSERLQQGSVSAWGAGNQPALSATWQGNQGTENGYIVLRFDLDGALAGTLRDATLELVALNSLPEERRFRVYGIDMSAELPLWNELESDFASIPGLSYDANITTRGLRNHQLITLGELVLRDTQAGQVARFDHANLTVFLNRLASSAAHDQLVTLLLQPTTVAGESISFASKEHLDTTQAPRLRMSRPRLVPELSGGSLPVMAIGILLTLRRPHASPQVPLC